MTKLLQAAVLAAFWLLAAGRGMAAPPPPPSPLAVAPLPLGDADRILVLAPHPDDEVLGTGGVLQEAARRGLPVRVVFLTCGDSNEWSFLAYAKRPVLLPKAVLAMGEIRQREAREADAALGIAARDLTFLGYPDFGTLDIWRAHWGASPPEHGRLTRARAVPYPTAFRPGAPYKGEEIVADLEKILRDFKPTQVFVSHPADHHPDHAALYLFARVALWDLQREVPAALHPFLIHYPGWPRVKGFHAGAELAPPEPLRAGFRWESRPLDPPAVAAKRRALAAHRTQFGYSASRLLPFVAADELFGDLARATLPAAGAPLQLGGLEVRRTKDQLEIAFDLPGLLPEGAKVTVAAFGYRPDRPFARMPKLEMQIEPIAWSVRDQGKLLPRATAWGAVIGRRVMARLPLAALGDPDRLFLQVRTGSRRTVAGQTPWWVVETGASGKL
jgi:LmbE family N-acetylglucosaminyl deacetylase